MVPDQMRGGVLIVRRNLYGLGGGFFTGRGGRRGLRWERGEWFSVHCICATSYD